MIDKKQIELMKEFNLNEDNLEYFIKCKDVDGLSEIKYYFSIDVNSRIEMKAALGEIFYRRLTTKEINEIKRGLICYIQSV